MYPMLEETRHKIHRRQPSSSIYKPHEDDTNMSERASSKGRASASEDLDLDPKVSAKHHVTDSGDVDEEDSTLPGDDAKAPPRRVSVGWSTESAVSDDKAGGESGAAAVSAAASNEGKRGGRRRRGSDNAGNNGGGGGGGGDGKNKNRYFDEDGDSTGAVHRAVDGASVTQSTNAYRVVLIAAPLQTSRRSRTWRRKSARPTSRPRVRSSILSCTACHETLSFSTASVAMWASCMERSLVAEAPRNTTRAVQSLKELDKDIKFALPSSAVC